MWTDPYDFGCFGSRLLVATKLGIRNNHEKMTTNTVGLCREMSL
jgi:hypothetical protein